MPQVTNMLLQVKLFHNAFSNETQNIQIHIQVPFHTRESVKTCFCKCFIAPSQEHYCREAMNTRMGKSCGVY